MTSVMIAEGAQPRVLDGHAGVHANLDGVEVANEAQDADDNRDHADDDPERNKAEHLVVVDGRHVNRARTRQDKADHVVEEERDRADGRNAGNRARVADKAELSPQRHADNNEGRQDRGHHDARIHDLEEQDSAPSTTPSMSE